MTVGVAYADWNKKVLKSECFTDRSKVEILFDLLVNETMFRTFIPKQTEYIIVKEDEDDAWFWIDKRENMWVIKPWGE